MRWIPFAEREPTDKEKRDGIWLGKHNKVRACPWSVDSDCSYLLAINMGPYTHWQPITPPTDLPPKPLPELSKMSKWSEDRTFLSILREGSRYWISADGGSLVVNAAYAQNADSIPLADIEALKEAGK